MGQTVGYLPREMAAEYHQPLRQLVEDGRAPWCTARIAGGGDRHYGVFLHLSGIDLMVLANEVEGVRFIEGDRLVAVSKRQHHQDVLRQFVESCGGLPIGACAPLVLSEISGGKWAGHETVEVHLDGERVGELTKGMADNYLPMLRPLLEEGGRLACEAFVCEEKDAVSISLLLPRT